MFENLFKPTMEAGNAGFVVLMGMGTVFVGLICIIILCKIVGLFFKNKKDSSANMVASAPVAAAQPIANRQELIAAISAVAAEELGTDVSAIRITSFKKL